MSTVAKLVSIGEGKGMGILGVETRQLGKATLALSVPLNSTFYTDITTENTTGSAVTKDFLAAFGTYDPATSTFTMYWGHVVTGVSIPTGTGTTPVECGASTAGAWDALGAIGTYDAATRTFAIESAMVLEDALTVTGVQVTGLSLHT